MLLKIKYYIVFLFVAFSVFELNGQDLSQIGKGDAIKVNGGISVSQLFNSSFGGEQRRDPYNYYLNGNLNFSIYGLSVPLTFNFSNQQFGFQQPFNQYGVSPTYKWMTLHAGYTSMSFSPYTLSGHLFLGGGIELRPDGPWSVSAMAGRLQKPIAADTAAGNDPMYQRFGYGTNVGYNGDGYQLDLILFKSKDDPNSIDFVPEDSDVLPEENMVVGLNGSTTLFSRFSLSFEYAQSALSRNVESEASNREIFAPFPSSNGLFRHRLSTSYYHALKSNLNYGGKGYTIGIGYERVDPEYKTHGAYYFNSDLENITVNGATQLFDNKVSISTNVGLQRDNLNDQKMNQMTRWVGAVNLNYTASDKLNLSSSYSNFQTYTNIRSQFEDINNPNPLVQPTDTLNFTQISQNISFNTNYILKSTEKKSASLTANLSAQQTADEQGGAEQNSSSMFYNGNLGYVNQWKPLELNVSASLNVSLQESNNMQNLTAGPVISASKSLFEKQLRVSLSSAINNSYSNSQLQNTILNCRLSATYSLKEKHNFSFTNAFINRKTLRNEVSGSTIRAEYNGTLTYSYQF
ncbi:hypothetical protein QYS49_34350 [Marivirga salinae]|uniref:Uncharacterized protein n=1 Tax=Marivirga salinarum TaxID=3059078 RepID=A0AA51ND04_9BACT|nr:hypothetical protein [Marivirga sp. BDSF4-3]WMN12699.1 hypothetical protein QYS49_34350 [Marivirga sp. BDSF4-3]